VLRYDFDKSVGYWVTMAQHAYFRAFSAKLAPLGITYRQAQVLGWLAIEGPMTQAQLAARMFVEPPSLVGVLDRMEHAGWIERKACCEDRRKKWITALPAVEPIWQQIVACGKELRRQATKGLSAEEKKTLRRLLAQVQSNVTSAVLDDSFPSPKHTVKAD
jgi:MarR family transcriptional regulator, transcriptional regulator for hemolysin